MTSRGVGPIHLRPPGGASGRQLVCALAVATLLAVASGSPGAAAQGWAREAEPAAPSLTDHTSLMEGDAPGLDLPAGALLLDLSWKLGLVLILAYGALWLTRHGLSVRRGPAWRGLQVIETLSLGGQHRLHLVRVGRRVLLIGATAQQLSTLAQIEPSELAPIGEAENRLDQLQALQSTPGIASLWVAGRRAVRNLSGSQAASPVGE